MNYILAPIWFFEVVVVVIIKAAMAALMSSDILRIHIAFVVVVVCGCRHSCLFSSLFTALVSSEKWEN